MFYLWKIEYWIFPGMKTSVNPGINFVFIFLMEGGYERENVILRVNQLQSFLSLFTSFRTNTHEARQNVPKKTHFPEAAEVKVWLKHSYLLLVSCLPLQVFRSRLISLFSIANRR